MALQTQIVPIDLVRSLDARTSKKLVLSGKQTTAQDVVFRGKVAERRAGFTSLGTSILGGTTLANLKKGYTFRNEIGVQGDSFWSWSPQDNAWSSMGRGFDLNSVSKTLIHRSLNQVVQTDVNSSQGYTCYVWQESSNIIRAQVVDETTGASVNGGPVQITTTGQGPKVIFFAGVFMVLYTDTGAGHAVKASTFTLSNPNGGWSALATVAASSNAINIDAAVVQNRAFVIYSKGADDSGQIIEINNAGTTLNGPVQFQSLACVTMGLGTSQDAFLFAVYCVGTSDIRFTILNLSLSITSGPTQFDTNNANSSTVYFAPIVNTSSCDLFYSYPTDGGSHVNPAIFFCRITSGGSAGTIQTFMRGTHVATKPFLLNNHRYLWAISSWGISSGVPNASVTVEQSLVLLEDTALNGTACRVSAQAMQGTARQFTAFGNVRVPDCFSNPNSQAFFTVFAEQFILNLTNNQNTSAVGISRLTVAPQGVQPITSTKLGNITVTGGGLLSIYDGLNPVELGFCQYPELEKIVAVGSGGNLSAGAYQVALTYEWVDLAGNRWQSAPTAAQSVTCVNSDSITVTLPNLRLTNKISPRALPRIVVWRSAVNGSTLYRDVAINSSTANSTSSDTQTYTITNADNAVTGNEILYTAGAISNIAPPAASYVWSHQGRLFCTGMEDPNIVWYSRKYVAGGGINFNDSLTFQVNPWGGANTGGASMDDKCVIFQQTATAYVYGDGPNDLGLNNTFSAPQLASPDIGCADARSIVVAPFGVLFLSQKGFYLLDRALQMQYIGAPVENLIKPLGYGPVPAISSVQLLQGRNQVRWTLQPVGYLTPYGIDTPGVCLVLDYTDALATDSQEPVTDRFKWSVFTNYYANDAVLWNGNYTQIGADNIVKVDSESVNFDQATATQGIGGVVETGWIKVNGIQGFQRVWRALFTGASNNAAHTFTVYIGYDYDPIYRESFVAGPLPISEPWQFRHLLSYKQKCEAVRFRIVASPETVSKWSLENITLELGVKKGAFKLPASTTV